MLADFRQSDCKQHSSGRLTYPDNWSGAQSTLTIEVLGQKKKTQQNRTQKTNKGGSNRNNIEKTDENRKEKLQEGCYWRRESQLKDPNPTRSSNHVRLADLQNQNQ